MLLTGSTKLHILFIIYICLRLLRPHSCCVLLMQNFLLFIFYTSAGVFGVWEFLIRKFPFIICQKSSRTSRWYFFVVHSHIIFSPNAHSHTKPAKKMHRRKAMQDSMIMKVEAPRSLNYTLSTQLR